MFSGVGLTDPGLRTSNQDCFITDPAAGVFILADGVSGAAGGGTAAQLSVTAVYKFLLNGSSRSSRTLEMAFLEANDAVCNAAAHDESLAGMASTLLAAIVHGNDRELQICSVGDSRAYLLSGSQLIPITQDQTWAAEVGPRLGLTRDAICTHPMRNALTMAIGCAAEFRVHSHTVRVQSGDQILLCSDGLHSVLSEELICSALVSEKSIDAKCHYLVEAAKAHGGEDNITVVLIEFR